MIGLQLNRLTRECMYRFNVVIKMINNIVVLRSSILLSATFILINSIVLRGINSLKQLSALILVSIEEIAFTT